ncbi:MAG: hypothetical protein U0176_04115 [Bacteroidia bacterium]
MSYQLFLLVKSLDKAEKKHFRAYAQRHVIGERNLYERLFDVLLEMEVYDDEQVRAAFSGEKVLSQWASFKTYLYQLLRRSLRTLHEDDNAAAEMQQLLQDITILHNKGLHDACQRLLNKCKRLAREQDAHAVSLECLDWERRLIKRGMPANLGEQLEAVAQAEQFHLKCLRLDKLVLQHYDRMYSYSQQKHPSAGQTSLFAMLEEIEGQVAGQPLPFNAHLALGAMRAMVATHLGRLEEASVHYREVVLQWQSRPLILAEHRDRYLMTLVNFLNTMYQTQNETQFQEALSIARSGHELRGDMQRFVRIMSSNLELLHLMNAGRYEEAEQIVPMLKDIVKEEPEFLRPAHIIAYSYNVAVLLFVRGRYRQSVEWLNRILDFPGHDIRVDIRNAAQILALIVHFELGNHDLLEYLLASALRKYSHNKAAFLLGNLVASHLKTAISAPTAKARAAAIPDLRKKYPELPESVAAQELGHQEVGIWLSRE